MNMAEVIEAFVHLQEDRYAADYDVAKIWSRTDVMNTLVLAMRRSRRGGTFARRK
jgi:hypothetical protein